jgi:AraC family transcriptional regulator, positive regulator of tynA and feaB
MNNLQPPSQDSGLDADSFQKKFSSMLCSVDCSFAEKPNSAFTHHLEGAQVGELGVYRYDGRGLRGGRRSVHHFREDELDVYVLLLPLTIPVNLMQLGRSAIVEPGTCSFVCTTKPFNSLCGTSPTYAYSELIVRIPGPLIRQRVPYIDECCVRPIAIRRGAGKVLQSLVETLIDERTDYSESQAGRFGAILLDVVANITLEAAELVELQSPQRPSAHNKIYEHARGFIESNLSNPDLDPALIAKNCHISVSYLHAVFAESSLSAAAYVREIRLQRCRNALQNPSLRYQSIIDIAYRWGFNCSSIFYRVYRARFGKCPSEDRDSALTIPQPSKH